MINYEMALSEIEMYKKAHESLSENLTHANKKAQQFKAERDKFEKMLNKECECGYKLEGQLHDMTKQRDTLIDDLSWYKAKVSRLERENTEQLALLKEFRKLIDYKLTLHQGSSMYREYRSKLDQLGVK